ncbi:rhomboid family intramembrane serine protease [Methylomonas paludis]|uniref:Rhomboid family intramembrane serine protease n=1 Tax=Methylomonas paludis TaxID=1173101 RepID=A0A975MPM5_9GAMM|nr:rhomboid family intramembrane serine protease [Methylomonas paludis]QWF71620.1 rhomboid family intramembrane serine protease [Methylomonas paludis]
MIPIRDSIPCLTRPYVTWAIMAICIIVFLVMLLLPANVSQHLLYLYGMVPIRYSNPEWAYNFGLPPDHYLSFLTSLFLHGGWIHIIVNMIFLWIFADNIEDLLGHGRFIVFYLLCGLLATYTQWYFTPQFVIPVVGASGAIAGVLGAYFVRFPYARVVILVPILFFPLFFEVPAIAFLGFWVIMQLDEVSTAARFTGIAATGSAWWAHIGGFVAGALLHSLFLPAARPGDKADLYP